MLLYPATDMAGQRPAYQRFTENLILTDKTMRWFIEHYVPDAARRLEWQAARCAPPACRAWRPPM